MIYSEIAKLEKVLLHKPKIALDHLTPDNCREFLFDDVLWVKQASEEHDYFEMLLRHNGVDVYLLHELLCETLSIKTARDWILPRRLAQLHHQATIKQELLDFLNSQDAKQVAGFLLGGLTLQESGFSKSNLSTSTMGKYDFLLPPLPNHLFTRDSSCWIGKGIVISAMHYETRVGETLNLAVIYKFHPEFKTLNAPIWYDGSEDASMPSIEGGDVLVINKETLVIGISQRTSPESIEVLAKSLFAAGDVKRIIAVLLPKVRAMMHLDTMMTMISHDICATAFPEEKAIRSWSVTPGDDLGELVIETLPDYYEAVARALNVDKLQLIRASGDYFEVAREQWSDCANLLTISPGEVVAYDRNTAMNAKLRSKGVIVHEIPSSELSRGRGGARCMSCPISRAQR